MNRQKFISRTKQVDDCWEWQRARMSSGYGKLRVDGKYWLAHRFSYHLLIGTIPNGLFVLHRCDNPCCVNPAHLRLGTHAENVADMMRKGRDAMSANPEQWREYGRRLGRSGSTFGENNSHAKLTASQVQEIRKRSANARALAARFGVNKSAIYRIWNGTSWTNLSTSR